MARQTTAHVKRGSLLGSICSSLSAEHKARCQAVRLRPLNSGM